MKIFYRSLQATFLVITAALTTLPVSAQLSREEREQVRQHERETRAARHTGPRQVQSVTQETMTLPAPIVVNFTERANYDLVHPKTDFTPHSAEPEGADDYKFQPKPLRPDAVFSNPPSSRTVGNAGNDMKALTNSPAPILSFNGVMGDGSEIPPDINVAAGINYVMETTNQSYGIYNKTTGALVSSVAINTFYNASGGNGYFDPHILYDAPHGRWLAVIDGNTSGGNGGLFLAVSQTNNPTGNWYVYTVDDGINANTLLDFPEMGYNQNWVVLTANLFSGSNPTTEIYIMNRASLYSGTQGTITHFSDANSFCVSAAQTMDTTTLTEWLVQNSNGSAGAVQVGSITGAIGSPTYNTGTQLSQSQTWSDNTSQAPQKNGGSYLIDNDDTRIYASEFINGSMWFAHTVWLPASNPTYSGVDWWQINPATMTVQQFGRVSEPSTPTWYYYPNIYANASGDALLGYAESSSSLYASAVYSFHASTDAINTMENLYTYQAGISTFAPQGFGADYRWGDYTGIAIDPVDNSFWAAGEWANNGNLWSTQIAHVGASAPITIPPVANFQANVTTSCTGAIQFTDLSTNNPTSWLWTFGDGLTSSAQNPAHTYLTNGTFTVTLKATNAYGNNTKTITGYITISEPAAPTAVGASHCGSGTFSLSATTTNAVKWYDSTGTVVSTANPFVTPVLNHTTTYYVQASVPSPIDSAGPLSNAALGTTGGYINTTYGLNFDVLQAGTLQSVYLYASAAGSITITIANSGGTTVNTATVNVPAGGSRVTLNFPLTVGTGYLINYSTTGITLYRNQSGAVYPYTDANGIVSITGNNAGTVPAYYYWFYDWYVRGVDCSSQSAPVTATVTAGITTTNSGLANVSCHGGTNGTVTITPAGGTPGYTYNWSNGQTTATLTGVASGNYTVTVHDAGSCSGTASETITQPNALNVSVTPANASCGLSTGSASASVSGGTSGYSYLWSNAATTSNISNLAPATYTLTVTDSKSCTATASSTITSTGGLSLSASAGNAACYGAATGSANVSLTGGTGTITYHWSNGGTTASIANIAAGTYTVTVSDASGCSGTSSTSVSQPSSALNVSVSSTNSGCGSPNGSALATVSGGTAGYSYLWSNSATVASISNLSAATYRVTVTDNHQCTSTASATISNSGLLNVSATPSASNCSGGSTGGANAVINGGTAPFNYVWSNGTTAASISGVTPGTYRVTATDNSGCSGTASVVISTGTAFSVSTSSTSANCFNASNGSASVNVTSGTSPYHYAWNNGSTTLSITGVPAGDYVVTVTDAHSCQSIDTITVSQPGAITIFVSAVQPTCSGLNNGSASVSATGGSPNYTYVWSDNSTGLSISNLSAGSYSVSLTDAHTCTSTSSFNITNPAPVTSTYLSTADSCFGGNDGSIEITPNGGTSPYTYLWSNTSTSATVTGLAAGSYTVTITDNHNCTSTATASVSQPGQIVVSTTTTDATNGQSNGTATVSNVSGGNPPYAITWSNGLSGSTINGLIAGTYTATVTDHSGCETTTTAVVTNSVGIATINADLTFTIYPNPAKTEVTVDAGNLDKETTLVLEDVLGQSLFTKKFIVSSTQIDLSNLSDGVYFIELRQGGKRAVRKFVINR